MLVLTLLFVIGTLAGTDEGINICTSDKYNKAFTSGSDYPCKPPGGTKSWVTYPNNPQSYKKDQELFDRNKCATCCKVLIVSDFNFQRQAQFTDQDDRDGFIRYVMDMEFDDRRQLRDPAEQKNSNTFFSQIDGYQQFILLRPLEEQNELQYFEFAEYNMFNPYVFPRRVHDIFANGNIFEDRPLIVHINKWGNEDSNGVLNQQFTYVHDYGKYYDVMRKKGVYWVDNPRHFYLSNTTKQSHKNYYLCYQAESESWSNRPFREQKYYSAINLTPKWHGNSKEVRDKLNTKFPRLAGSNLSPAYQIMARKCSSSPKQIFIPVFA